MPLTGLPANRWDAMQVDSCFAGRRTTRRLLLLLRKWEVRDLSPGVYPVTPITRTELLGTDNKVSKFQWPLIPMYGRTAYSMHGRTLSKGKIDSAISIPLDPTTGYAAMSRLRSASGVPTTQPFDLGFYQQGPTLEPGFFIQYNRMRSV